MARVRTDEWILNAATNRSVVVFCPNVDWVVRYRCPRVRMPNGGCDAAPKPVMVGGA